ncbi:VTC domain protein [Stieleria maiorica]|uniref:VTC domain protein n=1 Tax=Stieleria maiorica TaxID=2795974 RepID=A0A5B9MPL3_9BACT|nr:polyphosphate polymerase domain-containing protein [Stieleria maiorica]QEG01685.1 VTC domain protein [Stieleria maiorica]
MHFKASHDAIQSSRSELKFTIDPRQATAITDYLGARLRPDPHAVPGGYPVCSVYLDSADDLLMRQTNQGLRNRFKLRVRIYNDDPRQPAYLEIKRREGSAVKKQRCPVDRTIAATILSTQQGAVRPPATSAGDPKTQQQWLAFQEFCRLRDMISAIGTTYVYYRREAFVSPHNTDWRATFDRQLVASPYVPGSPLRIPTDVVPAGGEQTVVFELKFTDRFPNWMRDLVQTFNLVAGPFPKYVTCRQCITPQRSDAPNDSPAVVPNRPSPITTAGAVPSKFPQRRRTNPTGRS